jgi:hypothetical protein
MVCSIKGSPAAQALITKGVVLGGARCSVEIYVHEGLDSQCVGCLKWGHIQEKCPTPRDLWCGLCARGHLTSNHACNLMGCSLTKGAVCPHSKAEAWCENCGGNHFTNSNSCKHKKRAITMAWKERA